MALEHSVIALPPFLSSNLGEEALCTPSDQRPDSRGEGGSSSSQRFTRGNGLPVRRPNQQGAAVGQHQHFFFANGSSAGIIPSTGICCAPG